MLFRSSRIFHQPVRHIKLHPDNEGKQPLDTPIREDGENAYFASLPVKSMVQYMKEAKIPARVSYTAGTFVCNDIMYRVLYMIDKEYPHMRVGFVHVTHSRCHVHQVSASPH